MSEYMNMGAPIHRDDGTIVFNGEVFEPTRHELATRGYKLQPVGEVEDAEEPEPDPLDGVEFGSDEARELAEDEGLVAADFDGHLGTGQGHAFLKSDVEELI